MAQARDPAGLPILRAISIRLSSVKTPQLPHVVASQVQSIRECSEILSQPKDTARAGGDAGVVVHRYYTQIATLLQGRSVEERWAGAVLIKATVDAGGYEVLSKSKHWVSALLTNLRKSDPPSTRALYAATLTRIFALTWSYPSLIRDITTPALTPFIKTCISNVSTKVRDEKEFRVVLESFTHLVSHHHTTFRGHVKDIRDLLHTGSELNAEYTGSTVYRSDYKSSATAGRLIVALHQCEPKQGYISSWETAVSTLLAEAHRNLDIVLFGVQEDLDSAGATSKASVVKDLQSQSSQVRVSAVYTASNKLLGALEDLSQHVSNDSTGPTATPISQINLLVVRLISAVNGTYSQSPALRFAPDVARDERDACVQGLPEIHVATLHFVDALLARFTAGVPHLAHALIVQLRWLVQAEHAFSDVRLACYQVAQKVMSLVGPSVGKEAVEQLGPIISFACADLLPRTQRDDQNVVNGNGSSRPDGLLKQSGKVEQQQPTYTALQLAASGVLSAAYTYLPGEFIFDSLRTEMDRTVILARATDALTASVLSPGTKQGGRTAASLLPFLARVAGSDRTVDALLRPRMPVLQSGEVSMTADSLRVVSTAQDTQTQNGVEAEADAEEATRQQASLEASVGATRKRFADETSAPSTINDKRQRTTTTDQDQTTQSAVASDMLNRLQPPPTGVSASDDNDDVQLQINSEMASGSTTPAAPMPTQSQPNQGATGDTHAAEDHGDSDEEDFVIPDLDMDMSDDE